MKIVGVRRSLETCTEAGWDAFDYLLDGPMDDGFIESLRSVGGSFLYMKMLKKPFFKVESHHYILKGVKDNTFFRLACHRDAMDEAEAVVARWKGEQT